MTQLARQLEATIVALESQRALLGDAVVDTAVAPLRAQLAAIEHAAPPAPAPAVPAPPRPDAAPSQALRQVSILFMDVVGSTALSQRLDPEEVHAVMDGTLARGTALVASHGGRVLQYAGDSLLAVFGTPEAREDDAERAVLAGLALLAEGRVIAAEVRAEYHHDGFDVRCGVHTGAALLGGGIDADGAVRGLAVNVAARMEQTAPPGAMRISQDTYRLVRGAFDVLAQEPITVKGVDEPVVTWLVQRARPRALRSSGRGVEGLQTSLVGREGELHALREAWARLHALPGLSLQLVVAEAGMGKSRLLRELLRWTREQPERCHFMPGRADPQTQAQPYGLLRDVLALRLGIADGDSQALARQKVEDAIAPLFLADDGPTLAQAHAHLLGHLIGVDFSDSPHLRGILDDPAQVRSRAFHAAAQALRRIQAADSRPVLMALDDLHWADEGTLEFIDHLCRANHDVPMLVLVLTRPTLFERRPDWRERRGEQRIELAPLDLHASRQLAAQLLQRLPAVPPDLLQLLIGRAEGNPFFMEELVKMLVDQGALRAGGDGAWTLQPERLHAHAVPPTLTGVLQARLDNLPAAERLALQEASVIGMVFWEPALAAIDAAAPRSLPLLEQRQLVHARPESTLQGSRECAFSHQILRDVAYDTVLRRSRRDWHARTAAWLSAQTGLRAEALLSLTAEHFEKAGDESRACELYVRAAEAARQRYAHETTLTCISRALPLTAACLPAQRAELQWRALDARERTLDLLGRRDEQREDLRALAALAAQPHDDKRRADLATRHCLLALRSGDPAAAAASAREAMSLATRAGDVKLRLNAQRLLADTLARQGEVDAALQIAEQGLAEVRANGWLGLESRFLNALTVIAARRRDLKKVLDGCLQATRLRSEMGDRRNEAIGLTTLGGIWMALGKLEQAAQALDAGLRLHRAVGNRGQEPMALANLSQLSLWQGDAALARNQAQAALDIAVEVQAADLQAFALWCLGHAELVQGAADTARAAFERALVVAEAVRSAYANDARAGLARVAWAAGDRQEALLHVDALLGPDAAIGAWEGSLGERQIALVAWQVLQALGDARAKALLQAAHEELMAAAQALGDEALRLTFLGRVPEHRDLVAAWAAHGPG